MAGSIPGRQSTPGLWRPDSRRTSRRRLIQGGLPSLSPPGWRRARWAAAGRSPRRTQPSSSFSTTRRPGRSSSPRWANWRNRRSASTGNRPPTPIRPPTRPPSCPRCRPTTRPTSSPGGRATELKSSTSRTSWPMSPISGRRRSPTAACPNR